MIKNILSEMMSAFQRKPVVGSADLPLRMTPDFCLGVAPSRLRAGMLGLSQDRWARFSATENRSKNTGSAGQTTKGLTEITLYKSPVVQEFGR